MATAIFDPIPLTYRGLFADEHVVDAYQLGVSLVGASRIANTVCNFYLFGTISRDPRSHQVKFYVGPSQENGLIQELAALANSGHLPTFSPIIIKTAKFVIETLIEAMLKSVLNRKSEATLAIEAIRDLSMQHIEFAKQVHDGQMRDKERLYDLVEQLVKTTRPAFRDLPEPIGKSVREMQIGTNRENTVDEAAAEVLRAREPLELGDTDQFIILLDGVTKSSGVGRAIITGQEKPVPIKITDPAIINTPNIYTRALDEGTQLRVTAKPTLKDGEINKLFISDATPAD